jgi:fumarate reductase subunit D
VWTFWITVAAGLTFAGLLAPIVAVVLGIVLCLRHRDSPRGPGVLRGGTLVLWTSALLFLALALFEPS